MTGPPTHVTEVSVAEWVAGARLESCSWCVGGLLPTGYDAYGRLRHRDEPAGPRSDNGISAEALSVLCELMASHGSAGTCFFAVWEGYGWVRGGGQVMVAFPAGQPVDHELIEAMRASAAKPAFAVEVLKGPKLRLPHRDYLLFSGPLQAALEVGREPVSGWFGPHAPDFIWPEDRSWFIATDVDLAFGYVGGSASLIADVVGDDRPSTTQLAERDPLIDGEKPAELQFEIVEQAPGLPSGYSLTITDVERDDHGVHVKYAIDPAVETHAHLPVAAAQDERGQEYSTIGRRRSRDPAEGHSEGALTIGLPDDTATRLRIRMSWTDSTKRLSERPALELRVAL